MAVHLQTEAVAAQTAAAPGGAIVEARGVDKRYDIGKVQVHALCGVSLAVQRGEMIAIMGPSGSGRRRC